VNVIVKIPAEPFPHFKMRKPGGMLSFGLFIFVGHFAAAQYGLFLVFLILYTLAKADVTVLVDFFENLSTQ
jgi:hypothetical protein